MAAAQLLDRECFVCHRMIKVQRDETNNKWLKFNQDMTEHIDPQRSSSKKVVDGNAGGSSSSGIGLIDRITALEDAVKKLSTQIETLTELIRREPKQYDKTTTR